MPYILAISIASYCFINMSSSLQLSNIRNWSTSFHNYTFASNICRPWGIGAQKHIKKQIILLKSIKLYSCVKSTKSVVFEKYSQNSKGDIVIFYHLGRVGEGGILELGQILTKLNISLCLVDENSQNLETT